MTTPPAAPDGYAAWLAALKTTIRAARLRAALAVNAELISLYWQIGRDILDRQSSRGWGARVVDRLAADLKAEFPDARGFSRANLLYMRAFAEAWPDQDFVQRVVGQLPWGQNIELLGVKILLHGAGTPRPSSNTAGAGRCWQRRSAPTSTPARARR